jgi:hypothetical protein
MVSFPAVKNSGGRPGACAIAKRKRPQPSDGQNENGIAGLVARLVRQFNSFFFLIS